jgi:hypothetical protein
MQRQVFLAETERELKRGQAKKQGARQNVNESQSGVPGEARIEGSRRIRGATAKSRRPDQNQTAARHGGDAYHHQKDYGGPQQAAGWLGYRHNNSPSGASIAIHDDWIRSEILYEWLGQLHFDQYIAVFDF